MSGIFFVETKQDRLRSEKARNLAISIIELWVDGVKTGSDATADIATVLSLVLKEEQKLPEKMWLWKNGEKEFWAFDNLYPCYENGDPLVLGEPIGYAHADHRG